MTLTQILQKIRSVFYTKTEMDSSLSGKQNSLSNTQLNAVNSGITLSKVSTYDGYASSKADDGDVVHTSGDETINGIKSFSNDIRISKASPFCKVLSSGYIKGQAPTSNIYSGLRFFDDINSGSTIPITGGFEIEYNKDGYNKSYIASRNYAGETQKSFNVGLKVPNDDTRSIDFLPSVNNTINLGTSTNKWKTLYATSIFGGANNIDCSVDSQGDGWIRYTNGVQICWGEETVSTNTETAKTFPKSFIDANYCIVTTAATWALFSNSYRKNTGAFSVYVYHTTSKECSVYWQAIGKWK